MRMKELFKLKVENGKWKIYKLPLSIFATTFEKEIT